MKLVIHGGLPLRGTVAVPADKSITHRALMLATIAGGRTQIEAAGAGEDNASTAQVLASLGATIQPTETGWIVDSPGLAGLRAPNEPLDCGNSGTTMRLLAGVLAGAGIEATLIGDASLSRRPMGRICGPLRALGATITGQQTDGRELPPLQIKPGAMSGGTWTQAVASAQVKSAILLAGLCSKEHVEIVEPSISRDHTEQMLAGLGVRIRTETGPTGHKIALTQIPDTLSPLSSGTFRVPGDVSSAAFWVVAALLVPGSDVSVTHCGLNPTRTGLLDTLAAMGAKLQSTASAKVGGEAVGDLRACYQPREVNAALHKVSGSTIPRLIDELVVLGAFAAGSGLGVSIRDAAELRVKESDRIAETAELLRAFGASVQETEDGFDVHAGATLCPAHIKVGSDHRLALTAAVLACAAPGQSELDGFEIASVSYPNFVDDLRAVGAQVEVQP